MTCSGYVRPIKSSVALERNQTNKQTCSLYLCSVWPALAQSSRMSSLPVEQAHQGRGGREMLSCSCLLRDAELLCCVTMITALL